jgi:hypothetical protein
MINIMPTHVKISIEPGIRELFLIYIYIYSWSLNFNINVRETRRGNHIWTVQRQWQHWVNKTQDEDKKNTTQKTKKQLGPHQKSGMNPGSHEG